MSDHQTFDYVIVGGGSAGAVLANRLTENPQVRVCLLEAGNNGDNLLVRMPAGMIGLVPSRPVPINNWNLSTVPQPGLNHRCGYQPRGKGLGGSSAINGMVYIRGQREDYDHWRDLGCSGWGYESVLPYFIKNENNQIGANAWHGVGGPVSVRHQASPRPISSIWVEAGKQVGIPFNEDFNGVTQEGIGLHQVTQFWEGEKAGERCSAAAAYLHPIMGKRLNLTVITGAHASRLIWTNTRISGVEYRRGSQLNIVHARAEVLLCAGAFHSPQLLMLSGIGPGAHLQSHGIDVKVDLPGVGQNLQDHLDFTLLYESKTTDVFGLTPAAALRFIKYLYEWNKHGTGLCTTAYAEGVGFIRALPQSTRPDVQMHFAIGHVEDHGRKLVYGYAYCCHVCVLRPYSRGEVTLAGPNPTLQPLIDPRFLSDERDVQVMLAGVRRMREIMEAPALAPLRGREKYTAQAKTDEELLAHIRERADTIYHPVGTCKMGADNDPLAVVDSQLRVRGVEGLRVVDASVMPTLVSGNTNAPTMMIAEKVADMIKHPLHLIKLNAHAQESSSLVQ